MLIRQRCCITRVLDAGGRTCVHVANVIGILGLQLVQFVDAILHRIHLALYPLLARKRVHVTPETFLGIGLQRSSGGVRALVRRILLRGGG